MSDAWLAGTGMTPFGRSTPSLGTLAQDAVAEALADAGVTARDIDQVYFGSAAAGLLQGQEMIRGQVLLRDSGLLGSMMVNVENACATSSTALHMAVAAVRSGAARIALAVGAEELVVPSRERTFAALASATDTVRRPDMRNLVEAYALGSAAADSADLTSSPFMAHYAAKGAAYLLEYGGTDEDLADIVVQSRNYGAANPRAQFRTRMTRDEVMGGRVVAPPLRLAMCSPIGNGAAAVVVMGDAAAASAGVRGIRFLATSLVSHDPTGALTPTQAAAARAFEQAGADPGDIDVVEVHDAAASALPVALEELRLLPAGGALTLVRAGQLGPDGLLPVNTGGGLLSRGHPIGATGCAQVVELADQMRGRSGARQVRRTRLALAHNGGGVLDGQEAVVAVTILEQTHPSPS